MPKPSNLCECGCGEPAGVYAASNHAAGIVKGRPKRFIHGHHNRGKNHPKWKGGRNKSLGYIIVWKPGHHRADGQGYVREHVLVAEKALGKPLKKPACVHHVNGDKADNKRSNLVICQDNAYHKLLHARERAFRECGHASWRRCCYCKKYDDTENLAFYDSSSAWRHMECQRTYSLANYYKRKERNAQAV